jgi:hypothetical protein
MNWNEKGVIIALKIMNWNEKGVKILWVQTGNENRVIFFREKTPENLGMKTWIPQRCN